MNILFLTLIDFSSINERGIYTDLLRQFKINGHSLSVISPTEKRRKLKTHFIEEDGVRILKLQIGNIQKVNLIEKGFSTLFIENSLKKSIRKYFSQVKFDLILYSTPPITFESTVKYVKNRDNAIAYLLLKDIFPQNALDLGILTNKGFKSIIYNYFRLKEKKLYKISDYIGCMSQANVNYIMANNEIESKSKVEICSNSIEPITIDSSKYNINKVKEKYEIPINKTISIYGGNLGKPQGIDFLLECLEINENLNNSFIIIVGSGTEYLRIKEYFVLNKIKNAKLMSAISQNDFNELIVCCDIGLIFLDKRFTIPNFPSRLLSYMQASLPIFAITDKNTDVKELILKNDLGSWSESGNIQEFKIKFTEFIGSKNRLNQGVNSRDYLERFFHVRNSYQTIMNHFK